MLHKAILMFLMIALSVSAEQIPEFRFTVPINGTVSKNQLYMLQLKTGLIRDSASGFNDLRIFGKNGTEVPYIIINSVNPGEPDTNFPMEIVNYIADTLSVTIVARLPQEYQPVNRIYLDIPDRDFNRMVSVESSPDMMKWSPVGEGRIYDFSSQVNLRRTWFDLDNNYFRYFRFKINDETASDSPEGVKIKVQGLDLTLGDAQKKRLKIGAVRAQAFGRKKERIDYDEAQFSPEVLIDDEKNSVYVIEAGLPIDRILFDTGDEYYQRSVIVQTSTDKKEFKFFTQGQIYKFPLLGKEESCNTLLVEAGKNRFYKLQITNKNNPPLAVKNVTFQWVRKYIVFSAMEDGDGLKLCYGNRALARPEYDLGIRVNQGNWHQQYLNTLETGDPIENRSFRDETPAEEKAATEKMILTAVILLIVGFLGFWLVRLLKNQNGLS